MAFPVSLHHFPSLPVKMDVICIVLDLIVGHVVHTVQLHLHLVPLLFGEFLLLLLAELIMLAVVALDLQVLWHTALELGIRLQGPRLVLPTEAGDKILPVIGNPDKWLLPYYRRPLLFLLLFLFLLCLFLVLLQVFPPPCLKRGEGLGLGLDLLLKKRLLGLELLTFPLGTGKLALQVADAQIHIIQLAKNFLLLVLLLLDLGLNPLSVHLGPLLSVKLLLKLHLDTACRVGQVNVHSHWGSYLLLALVVQSFAAGRVRTSGDSQRARSAV